MAESRQLSPKLSAWLRNRTELGVEPGEIDGENLKTLAKDLPTYSVSDRMSLLLRAIERKTTYPGEKVHLNPVHDYTLAWASSGDEFVFLVQGLMTRGFLSGETRSDMIRVAITPDGWDRLETLASASAESNQVFVAMSFSTELITLWENGIRPAIRRARFNPYRIDAEPHLDRIDAKIISEIQNSRFVVADVTQQKPGVYFEAGFALGIGIPVFWCVREDELDIVHFDTRQYNHLVWNTPEELEEKLYDFVRALIGTGRAN